MWQKTHKSILNVTYTYTQWQRELFIASLEAQAAIVELYVIMCITFEKKHKKIKDKKLNRQ